MQNSSTTCVLLDVGVEVWIRKNKSVELVFTTPESLERLADIVEKYFGELRGKLSIVAAFSAMDKFKKRFDVHVELDHSKLIEPLSKVLLTRGFGDKGEMRQRLHVISTPADILENEDPAGSEDDHPGTSFRAKDRRMGRRR